MASEDFAAVEGTPLRARIARGASSVKAALGGQERPTGRYTTWFRRAMWVGIVQDWVLGVPALFAPERTLRAVKQRPTGDPTWTAFASLLVILLSVSYIPGAQNPHHYRASAWISVAARPPGVLFFLVLRPRVYPLFGIIDALLFCVQGPLLFLAMRERPGRDGAPAAADQEPAYAGPRVTA